MNTLSLANPFNESRLNAGGDFRPEWDVPNLNRVISNHLAAQIRAVKGRNTADPAQRIQVLLAPPGYGKTHLFGRIGYEMDTEVLFVFVPAFEDVSRPLEHIRWHVVESLFRERPDQAPALHAALARLCRPSFIEYVTQFPPSQAARHEQLRLSLEAGPEAVLGLVQAVKPLAPFRKLATSLASRIPEVPAAVFAVLSLGWSPVGDLARRWLRGESLPDSDLEALGLKPDVDPPTALEVLKAVAALFQYETPVVLCCDQMEMVLRHPTGPEQVTAPLIEILHQIPCQVLILGCLQTEWPKFLDKSFLAFRQRLASPQSLDHLTDEQAVQLISRRLQSWDGDQAQRGATWPFDESSVLSYVRDQSQNPRVLVQRCEELFRDWLAGDRKSVIYVVKPQEALDPAQVFLRLWNSELEKIAQDPATAWSNYQEDRLYRGVREIFALAREAGRDLGGVRIRNVAEGALRQRGKSLRRALAVDLTVLGQACQIVVPVTAMNNGREFRYYFEDIELALSDAVTGCLLVHRQTDFAYGPDTGKRLDPLLGSRIRIFSMEDNAATLQRLECLLRFLDRAVSQELQIDSVTLSPKDCQDYVLKTAVLDSLDLLKALGAWRKVTPAKPVTPATTAKATSAGLAASPTSAASPASAIKVPVMAATGPAKPPTLAVPQPVAKSKTETISPASDDDSAAPRDMADQQSFAAKYEPWAQGKLGVLVGKLKLWGLPVTPVGIMVGPSFARLKVEPAGSKTTFKKVCDKATDLKIQLGLHTAPLIDSQPGYISVDVELPARRTVTLTEALAGEPEGLDGQPAVPVGVDVSGQSHWLNLADTSDCHVLIAGTTGSGKSECLRSLIAALATRLPPESLQFVLIDPKRLSFNLGTLESPYLLFPVAHEAEQSVPLLQWCMKETDKRYETLAAKKKTNVDQLEDQSLLPRVVVVIDEYQRLLDDKDTKTALNGLVRGIGAMSRAAGIHLVLATQRPDKDVVIPLVKNNLPGRVAFRVVNTANSNLIIGDPSAAYLLGNGDLIWLHGGGLLRLQGPFVTQAEFEKALRAH